MNSRQNIFIFSLIIILLTMHKDYRETFLYLHQKSLPVIFMHCQQY